jgi:hypothetical protein
MAFLKRPNGEIHYHIFGHGFPMGSAQQHSHAELDQQRDRVVAFLKRHTPAG